MFAAYRKTKTTAELVEHGFTEDMCWGTRVADRAVDFLNSVDDEPFVLVASFDEITRSLYLSSRLVGRCASGRLP